MLKEIIDVAHGFQSSVNIEYDFNDAEKISGFIPTTSALDIINNILLNTEFDHLERAKILTGAYGRGKSHIVLVALSILYNKDRSRFEKLIDKIKNIDEDTYKRIDNYILSKNRLLPVIINGNSGNLTQSFLGALQQALKLYELEDIMPETHFTAALNTIKMWEEKYPDTYERFVQSVGVGIEKFIKALTINDVNAYMTFNRIYPELTAGSSFNPFVGFNIVDIYDKVNVSLKEKGFNGMYVVYDEFGKYLESNIASATESETKMLQDFAEKCNRESSQQLHLLLICHKDISNYIDANLPQEKVNGWRGISGRFEHISISNHFHQMYEIISYTLNKNAVGWSGFSKKYEKKFSEILESAKTQNFLSGKDELVVFGCYPLHPVTSFLLPRLSERVAQNERTLFTFLTSQQKYTLREFIDNCEDEFPVVTPDYLYDYFEQELRKELNSSELYKTYHISSKILGNIEKGTLSSKIIKTIAVIYFVQQFERVAPTVDTICSIFNVQYSVEEVMSVISNLINNAYIVYIKNSNRFMCLKESSGVDIQAKLADQTEKLKSEISLQDALNKCAENNYLYPVRHNEINCLTRYFDFSFLSYSNLSKESYDFNVSNGACGKVYAVFCETEDEFNELSVKEIKTSQLEVLIIPKSFCSFTDHVYRYLSAIKLRNNCEVEDVVLRNEYDLIIEDLSNVVYSYISMYTRPELQQVEYYYLNDKKEIYRRSHLTEMLSQICDDVYKHTPIINNESINKDFLPTVAVNSRAKLIKAILENDNITENLGLVGSGQDVSFMRSTLIQTNVLMKDEDEYYFSFENSESSIRYILDVIRNFFARTADEGEKSFAELYDILIMPQNEIGMKKGAIPVYIAVALRDMKDHLVFKCDGVEIRISADTLNSINLKPESYTVMLEDWNEEKTSYIQVLSEIFADTTNESERQYNSFTYIVNAMSRWYLSLPKCSKLMKKDFVTNKLIAKQRLRFINSLNSNIVNPHDYIMKELPKLFGQDTIGFVISDSIKATKQIFDNGKITLINAIVNRTRDIFSKNINASLTTALSEWYNNLSQETLENLFPNKENTILSMIRTVTNDEVSFAERIGKAVTGLRVDDWDENIFNKYIDGIVIFKDTVDQYNSTEHKSSAESKRYKIIVVDENGKEDIKSFERTEYSNRAKLLYQDITGAIEDMGQSITEQEKRQVLIEILSNLC